MADSDEEFNQSEERDKFRQERSDFLTGRPANAANPAKDNEKPANGINSKDAADTPGKSGVSWSSYRGSGDNGHNNDRSFSSSYRNYHPNHNRSYQGGGSGGRDQFGRDIRPSAPYPYNSNHSPYGPARSSYDMYGSGNKRHRPNWENMFNSPGARSSSFSSTLAMDGSKHSSNLDNSNFFDADDSTINETDELTQPQMLTFKQYICHVDEAAAHSDIDEAVRMYKEYQTQFKQKQIRNFFNAHKREEWFRLKYHPVDSIPAKCRARRMLVHRRQAFFGCLRDGIFNGASLDVANGERIVKILDDIVFRLENMSIKAATVDLERKKLQEAEEAELINGAAANGSGNANNSEVETMEVDVGDDKTVTLESAQTATKVDAFFARPKSASHKTASIFLRQLPPDVTIEEVEALFKVYPGFLRIALSDPQFDKSFQRKGWVSFERSVNIKDIYLKLNNAKIRDTEIGAIINKDLSKRIRSVNGLCGHQNAVQVDLKLAVKLVLALDESRKIWDTKKEDSEHSELQNNEFAFDFCKFSQIQLYGYTSQNPLLLKAADYLIEEASAEEEELLGCPINNVEPTEESLSFQRDLQQIQALDLLIYYLRIVHSFDYYYHGEYANEDEMPNRLGIVHVRGLPPTNNPSKQDLDDFIRTVEKKVDQFLQLHVPIDEKTALLLGRKNVEAEVRSFIDDNTIELGKDKWLCPLSGKKFKGADFVHKHIENKHSEKLEEVRRVTQFFNNYVMDPKRPMLPEHPANRAAQQQKQEPTRKAAKVDQKAEDAVKSDTAAEPSRSKKARAIVGYNDLDDKLEMI